MQSLRRLSLRAVADAIRLSLVAGVVVLPLMGRGGSAWAMALIATAAILIRFARAPAPVELAFLIPLALDAWLTALGAFDHWNRQDHIGHFTLAAAVTPVLCFMLARLDGRRRGAPGYATVRTSTVLAAGLATIALGVCWEAVEMLSDLVLRTDMSLGSADTLGDLTADVSGAVVGAGAALATLATTSRRRERRGAAGHDPNR